MLTVFKAYQKKFILAFNMAQFVSRAGKDISILNILPYLTLAYSKMLGELELIEIVAEYIYTLP